MTTPTIDEVKANVQQKKAKETLKKIYPSENIFSEMLISQWNNLLASLQNDSSKILILLYAVPYVMILELEETNKSIIIYNLQGQKIQNILLQKEDPCADQRINLTKGETLWFEENKLITISGYKEPFQVDGEMEITTSPVTRSEDCLKVWRGLKSYHKEKAGDIPKSSLRTLYTRDPVAELFQESLWLLDFDNLFSEVGIEKTTELLMSIEKSAYTKGARRAYYVLINGRKHLAPLCPVCPDHIAWGKSLKNSGYDLTDEVFDLEEYNYKQYFYKDLSEEQTMKFQTVDNELQWNLELDDEEIPQFYDNFGIFIRKNGVIKGGLLGTINHKAVVPHGSIEVFWIDDKRRRMRLGTKIMEFALNHIKECGARITELYTTDFEAPGFYEKMGFKKILTYPNIFKTLDGKLNNSYLYRKEL